MKRELAADKAVEVSRQSCAADQFEAAPDARQARTCRHERCTWPAGFMIVCIAFRNPGSGAYFGKGHGDRPGLCPVAGRAFPGKEGVTFDPFITRKRPRTRRAGCISALRSRPSQR